MVENLNSAMPDAPCYFGPCAKCKQSHGGWERCDAILAVCPFCGEQPKMFAPEDADADEWEVRCEATHCAAMPVAVGCSAQDAADGWNRRHVNLLGIKTTSVDA